MNTAKNDIKKTKNNLKLMKEKLSYLEQINPRLARAKRLTAIRKFLGFKKAEDFLQELGIKAALYSYYRWENGNRAPNDEILREIAEKAHINPNWLIFGEGDPLEGMALADADKEDKSSEFAYAMLAQIRTLEEKGKIPPLQTAEQKQMKYANKKEAKLNKELLQYILTKLYSLCDELGKPHDHQLIAEIAATIYENIISMKVNPNSYQEIANLAIESFKYKL